MSVWNPDQDEFDQYKQYASGGQPQYQGSEDDIRRLYRDILGRDVDPGRELESEIENLGKYGLGQLEQNLRERAAPTMHRPYDSQTNNPNEQAANAQADAAFKGTGAAVTNAWLQRPAVGGMGGGSNPFMELLMQRATQGLNVTGQEPHIRSQVDSFRAQGERARRGYLSDLAEREGPYANLRGEQRMSAERLGQGVGAFEAELMGREVDARRREIMQALALYGSQLSSEQRMALEMELAQLGASTQRYGIDASMDQFLRELALREWMAGEDNDFRWAALA